MGMLPEPGREILLRQPTDQNDSVLEALFASNVLVIPRVTRNLNLDNEPVRITMAA